MTATTDLAVAVWPGIEPRLLRQGAEDYADYRDSGGYRPLDDVDHLLSQVDLSGVLGRGGAAFPLAVKLQDGPRQRPSGRRRRGGRQRRRGRTSVGQGPLAAAAPPAPGARRAAARRRGWSSAERAHVYVSDPSAAEAVQTALAAVDAARARRPGHHDVYGRPRLRRRRGDGGGARPQRRPGQADGQAAAPVRGGRRPPADHGQQCRDACAHPVPAPTRRRGVPRPGHVDVAGDVSRDHHRRGQAARRSTRFRTAWHSPSCSTSTACPPIRCTAC